MTAPSAAELVEQRFWNKVEKKGPDECWPWLGSKLKKDGRGLFWDGSAQIVAPRFAWFLATGERPASHLFVCHTCDNGNCVNPAHLWLGTNRDNLLDAGRKGRTGMQRYPERNYFARKDSVRPKGEKHGSAKLTNDQVRLIRKLAAEGWRSGLLGQRFGVSRSAILHITSGQAWTHVTD